MTGFLIVLIAEEYMEGFQYPLFKVLLSHVPCMPRRDCQPDELIRIHVIQRDRDHGRRQVHMYQQPAGTHEIGIQFLLSVLYNFFTAVALDSPSIAMSFSPIDNAIAGYSSKSALNDSF